MGARTFTLQREHDVSGVSGTGTVADGVTFDDGVTVLHWRGERRSTVVWPTLNDVEAIHGHGGATKIVWDDEPYGSVSHMALREHLDHTMTMVAGGGREWCEALLEEDIKLRPLVEFERGLVVRVDRRFDNK